VRYIALALDFDGTLAKEGYVAPLVIEALVRARLSGRRLVMVTGRELPDLMGTFTRLDLFDRVIAENGALSFAPASSEIVPLAPPPPNGFIDALHARGIRPSVGAVIVATLEAHQRDVEDIIARLHLPLDVILNKGSVMVVPSGVNKGTGIAHAAAELDLDLRHVVGMGDGENDHSLLRACGLGIAVGNAVAALKLQADAVTVGDAGEGVIEVVNALVADDLEKFPPRPRQAVEVAANDAAAKVAG
jgi:hydroxymethylpyrimidine pyrophosphatase-like HAD family hydrolase